jgi:hypothetical protein
MIIIGDTFYNLDDTLGRRNLIPKQAGLYLVGNVILNPTTNEIIYLVKVGMSTNLYDRMKNYASTNPLMYHIDYLLIGNECDYNKIPSYEIARVKTRRIKPIEEQYHNAMEKLNFPHCEYAKEWFIVSKETYLEICSKKFKYFNIGA